MLLLTFPVRVQEINCHGQYRVIHSPIPVFKTEISVTTNNISVDVWSSVLTIRALPINDGIGVQCNIISLNSFDLEQSGAILTIKGKLDKQ